MKKIYKCCICHKILEEKPIRLVKQLYGVNKYKQYSPIENYDFCIGCYKIYEKWINKHKEQYDRVNYNDNNSSSNACI